MFQLYEDYLEASYNKKLVLFGASVQAIRCIDKYLINEEVSYFCDNDKKKWGSRFNGIEVFSTVKLEEDNDNIVVIITSMHYIEIYKQLKELGIKYIYPYSILRFKVLHSYQSFLDSHKNICSDLYRWNYSAGSAYKDNIKIINDNIDKINEVRSYLSDDRSVVVFDQYVKKMKYNYMDYSDIVEMLEKQYFVEGIFKYSEDEVFVDVGCYDGYTSLDFAKVVNYKFKNIYCFEPDKISYERSLKRLNQIRAIEGRFKIYQQGLSNENKKIMFHQFGDIRSNISADGDTEIEVVKLDDKISDKVTFIKIDIEGAELDALMGAANIIKTYNPKLAMSIYHKFTDLWEIPLFIKKLVPEYKIYVRHHAETQDEKVLYASID